MLVGFFFASRNNCSGKDRFININKKGECKESVYAACERIKKRLVKSLNNKHLKSKFYQNLDNSPIKLCQDWMKTKF